MTIKFELKNAILYTLAAIGVGYILYWVYTILVMLALVWYALNHGGL